MNHIEVRVNRYIDTISKPTSSHRPLLSDAEQPIYAYWGR